MKKGPHEKKTLVIREHERDNELEVREKFQEIIKKGARKTPELKKVVVKTSPR